MGVLLDDPAGIRSGSFGPARFGAVSDGCVNHSASCRRWAKVLLWTHVPTVLDGHAAHLARAQRRTVLRADAVARLRNLPRRERRFVCESAVEMGELQHANNSC
jgi:hypothetical protein